MPHTKTQHNVKEIINSLGIVFGDIGTSPIYTLVVIFLITKPTEVNIIGILSLIVWTLIILVTIEYAWLATSLSKKGEGGTIVLKGLLVRFLKSGRQAAFVSLLSFIGISLLVGDGVITPAISILSAVEGILLIPGLESIGNNTLIFIAGAIAFILFAFQKRGTEKIAGAFGPVMLIWFAVLTLSGVMSIINVPSVLTAINPYYAVNFMTHNGIVGFFVLSEVILCATGGEALYADMGHLGRFPIIKAWCFVFIALVLNYLGQGAFLIQHPEAKNVLFEMIFNQAQFLYIPFLILTIIATVIASQAMISGMFSVVYQGIVTHTFPMFKVDYTSREVRSQIYIPAVNWFLLFSVIFIMLEFKESARLAAAYGLAVTGTMTLTGIMMTWIFYLKRSHFKAAVAAFVTIVDAIFLVSNMYKIPHGGYWSIIIAAIPFTIILIYTMGQKRLYNTLRPLEIETFLTSYRQIYQACSKINGTALFFTRSIEMVHPYIVHTMFRNNIIYEDNILLSISIMDEPFGVSSSFKGDIAPGLRIFVIRIGYMEVVDVERILKRAGIHEKTIFYGIEDITTPNIIWKIFSAIKKLTPTFVKFYKLPINKLHGVVTRIEM
ncbi:MAG: KUP/HAK/KT family potassium transporter [Deltaproteobacteria bacterium]|nr:KUP/HAK/KT family potassium transporter [Deltaproteobacteria bacterium]